MRSKLVTPRKFASFITQRGFSNTSRRRLCRRLHPDLNLLVPARASRETARRVKRTLFTSPLPSVLVPPVVFVGLVLTLWFYKCCMMVLFQNKIIYMPSVPPFSRREKIADYARACRPVVWEETGIRSLDGTRIALCVGRIAASEGAAWARGDDRRRQLVILYFQGNASSLPPRLPGLSNMLRALQSHTSDDNPHVDCTIVALSYRGFWTSKGHPSQRGIELDARAALHWIQQTYTPTEGDTRLVLWGQSIGAGVAAGATAKHFQTKPDAERHVRISGLILETPFVSVRSMLVALYPQKWLPYRYLWPFLRNWWDSEAALRSIASATAPEKFPVLVVAAEKDEVVPPDQADQLERLGGSLGLRVERRVVPGALHTEAMARQEGRSAVAEFLRRVTSS